MAATEARLRANAKYRKNHVKVVTVAFYDKDKDVYEVMQAEAEKQNIGLPSLVRQTMREKFLPED